MTYTLKMIRLYPIIKNRIRDVLDLLKNNYEILINKKNGKESILVIGDSHAEVFKGLEFSKLPKYYFDVVSVGGATVSGLSNPNSKTQAINIFTAALKKTNSSKVIFLLGEVDTGFVIWHRAENYNQDVMFMLNQAIDNYKSLINLANELGLEIECLSTPLPTISDDNENWGEVANLRKNIKASQLERTKLTIDFNRKMEYFCKKIKVKYYNLDKDSLGENGIVKPELLNDDPLDHHYNNSVYAKMIIQKLDGLKK